ncbi:MAG TPA: GNAT family N-acetyltransferase [Candidatus Acidoferrum sp.]|nr:GNAT family N-acetyltransferase [Candidatus Acidoferrum sp.]
MDSVLVTSQRQIGEPVQNLAMFARAWDECIELQVTSKEEWVGRALLSLQSLARTEVAVIAHSEVVGGLVIAHDPWDAHVGPCISVFAQYVLPEFRHTGVSNRCMREAVRIARASGAKVLAFTHRKGPWRYSTIYRRIHEDPKG